MEKNTLKIKEKNRFKHLFQITNVKIMIFTFILLQGCLGNNLKNTDYRNNLPKISLEAIFSEDCLDKLISNGYRKESSKQSKFCMAQIENEIKDNFSYRNFSRLVAGTEYFYFFNNDFKKRLERLYIENKKRIFKDLGENKLSQQNTIFLFDSLITLNYYLMKKELRIILFNLENSTKNEKGITKERIVQLYSDSVRTRQKEISLFLREKYVNILFKEFELPQVDFPNKYYSLNYTNKAVVLKSFKFPKGDFLVSIVNLNCSYSIRALKKIIKNKDLIEKNIFLVPPGMVSSIEEIHNWNSKNKEIKLNIVEDTESWPKELDFMSIPHFYHFISGKFHKEVVIE